MKFCLQFTYEAQVVHFTIKADNQVLHWYLHWQMKFCLQFRLYILLSKLIIKYCVDAFVVHRANVLSFTGLICLMIWKNFSKTFFTVAWKLHVFEACGSSLRFCVLFASHVAVEHINYVWCLMSRLPVAFSCHLQIMNDTAANFLISWIHLTQADTFMLHS